MKNKIHAIPFQIDLIEFTADLLLKNNEAKDLSKNAVVFPGKRPALYLQRVLFEKISAPFFPPRIFSVDTFIKYIYDKANKNFREADLLEALYLLYRILQNQGVANIGTYKGFAQFLPLGIRILACINEFEQWMLSEKRINEAFKTDENARKIPFIENLSKVIAGFKDELKNSKRYTRGTIYRDTAEIIKEVQFNEFEHIYFMGFFALTRSEVTIVQELLERNIAIYYTQIDDEIWAVIEALKKELNAEIEFIQAPEPSKSSITYLSGPDSHAEVLKAGEVLISEKPDPSSTVVVLAEPSSLIPFLSTVITRIDTDYNVTMGYPFKRTPIYNLINSILKAQETKRDEEYYVRSYLEVITHPYIKNIGINGRDEISRILIHSVEQMIAEVKRTFLTLEEIERGLEIKKNKSGRTNIYTVASKYLHGTDQPNMRTQQELKRFLKITLHEMFFRAFERITTLNELLSVVKEILDIISAHPAALFYPLSGNIFIQFYDILKELAGLPFLNEKMQREELFALLRFSIENERIPFEGIPLKGLQVAGILETRNLWFRNVIFLDANEGIIPAGDRFDPLMPSGLRRLLDLPTHRENEEVFRYHFRRLVKGAENVFIFYIENDERVRSRFVEELIWEEQKKKKSYEEEKVDKTAFRTIIFKEPAFEVKKDKRTISKLLQIASSNGFSPSALDMYLTCPLKFYFNYVLRLKEKEEVGEDTDAMTVGGLVHEILRDFFAGFVNQTVRFNTEKDIQHLQHIADTTFKKYYGERPSGGQSLLREILRFRLNEFLKRQARKYPDGIAIIGVERELKAPFLKINSSQILLKGIIDRIEKRGDIHYIIDYKTGTTAEVPSNTPDGINDVNIFTRKSLRETLKSTQLPVYLYLYRHHFNLPWNRVNAALYMLTESNESKIELPLFRNGNNELLMEELYIPAIKFIANEILNPEIPFTRDDSDDNACNWCPYPALCRRM